MKAPIIVLIASAALFGASLLAAQTFGGNRPSSPIFAPIRLVGGDERKIALGRDLFVDRRLSMSTRLRCASCHDIGTNGASANALDRIDSGQIAPFNTPSVFNSAFNYRFGWAGRSRNIRDQILRGMRFDLNAGSEVPLQRLRADPKIVQRFRSIYGNYPTDVTVADALSAYVETLVTPDAPFDRWRLCCITRAEHDAGIIGEY